MTARLSPEVARQFYRWKSIRGSIEFVTGGSL
jgi:hypothetical protein